MNSNQSVANYIVSVLSGEAGPGLGSGEVSNLKTKSRYGDVPTGFWTGYEDSDTQAALSAVDCDQVLSHILERCFTIQNQGTPSTTGRSTSR